MAMADYRLCDVCGGKAFYDANLNYNSANSKYDRNAYRIAGKLEPWGAILERVGDWAVICADCSPKFRTKIVPVDVTPNV